MSHKPDDWEKPRGKGQHLTGEEVYQLRQAHRAGRTPRDAAREIKCSSRIAYKYFKAFDGDLRSGQPRRLRIYTPDFAVAERAPAAPTPSRFYKGSFDL
ncbi:hypothetical protein IVB03_39385 [Bradyrhizobium sp. 168]|uniref:hypothetical protein n=1 Tax=Bradyrhizobium sp. 168 TaxID=2782639 RepID=UPI001FF8F595|nr:hypothetical protein [Bradyrhizobium sp. 168]MCK1585459.1 hypothetical protein [Bradyrhizobium sp. 168]